jgi:hypothetical protein
MNVRIAELHSKVFSTPRNSPEREQAYSELSESDRTAVFNLEKDYILGRITRQDIAEMKQEGNETMTYEQFVKKSESGEKGTLRELSKFAKESQELYRQYRERYHREQDDKFRRNNPERYVYYIEQMGAGFGRKNSSKTQDIKRLEEERKKRSEILAISDTMARHKAIVENMALFGR